MEERIVTISTHNGSKSCREHNIRNPKVVSKESHIDPNGTFEIWHDEKPRDAYERIFGEALAEYNAKQTRRDRRKENYYDEICKDKKKHPVYEMIIGVYGKKPDGTPVATRVERRNIMKQFVDEWNARNPHLELIGAYYHGDESTSMGSHSEHTHVCYIPRATDCKRGLRVQNSLTQALRQQGFQGVGSQTEQIQWEARENQELGRLCAMYGLTVIHPGSREHLDTASYKAQKNLEEINQQILERQEEVEKKEKELEQIKIEYETIKAQKSLSECVQTAYKPPEHEIEVLEHHEAKKLLNGQIKPPTVTIKESDFQELKERAMASQWIRKALEQLKLMGDKLMREVNQKRRIREAEQKRQEAEIMCRATEKELEKKSQALSNVTEAFYEIKEWLQEKRLQNGFTLWELFQEQREREREERELE